MTTALQIYMVPEAAGLLGCHRSYVHRLCAEHSIGQRKGRFIVLSEADLDRLRPLVKQRGNPEFGPGYRPPKKKKRKKAKS